MTIKKITFSADERLIDRAREKARQETRTLNDAFQDWLTKYSREDNQVTVTEIRKRWKGIKTGGPYSREEINKRR